MRNMKWLCAIPLLTLLFALPAYAEEGMDVEVNISGGSDVEVNTGDNSEVDVNTGANNNVYINGQDINQPTVIKKTIKQGYSGALLSQRISKLEYWKIETLDQLKLFSDAIAKLIWEIEQGKVKDEQSSNQVLGISAEPTNSELKPVIDDEQTLEAIKSMENKIAELKSQAKMLEQQAEQNRISNMWIVIGLSAGLAIVGGLMMYRTRR